MRILQTSIIMRQVKAYFEMLKMFTHVSVREGVFKCL